MARAKRITPFPIYVLLTFSISVKRKRLLFWLLGCMVFFYLIIGAALSFSETPFPKPKGLVNDFANVITPAYKQKIAAVTRGLLQKTGITVVVVTMPDIGGAEYNDYANRLYRAWGIGKKGEDKGVLIFVTVRERKMRIETGYGVEGILPDGIVGEIRDRYMTPLLKQDKFGEGLLAGALAVAQVIAKHAGIKLTSLQNRETAEARKRFDEFVKKYGVRDWPSMKKFSVNPFVYEGKTVAIVSKFKTMISATEGIFESKDEPFIVSNMPKGLFTSEAHVVIAGRVLGKKETNFPVVGTVLVPHLKFVGGHFCRDWRCSDIIVK